MQGSQVIMHVYKFSVVLVVKDGGQRWLSKVGLGERFRQFLGIFSITPHSCMHCQGVEILAFFLNLGLVLDRFMLI